MWRYRFNTRLLATIESPVAKKATSRSIRWRSAAVMRPRRSARSVEKSTSSTVQVFLIALRYISKNCGYAIGRSVRFSPGSSSMGVFLFSRRSSVSEEGLLAGFAGAGVLQRAGHRIGGGHRRGGAGRFDRRRSRADRGLGDL